MPEASCQVCSKVQADLDQPLKQCGDCQSGSYCSRDCQKADWTEHKKSCTGRISNGQTSTLTSIENFLDTSGDMIEKSFNMGCHDQFGNPLGADIPVGQRRNRTFDPAVNSNYTEPWSAPYEMIRHVPEDGVTFLCHNTADGDYELEQDTIVMEVGARKKNGLVIAARSFGGKSKYDRTGMPERKSTHAALSCSICIGCQQVAKIAEINPVLKRVIIMTSSKIIADGVNKLFDWFKDGFPQDLPGGMNQMDWIFLHHNIKILEDKGIAVKLWKIKPEFITEACSRAWNSFLDLENAPIDEDPNNCACSDCIVKKQLNEIEYAKTGVACCPCAHSMSLIAKNLKRGDKFVITNIAGVTEPTLTMEVDGGNTFRHPRTSSA